MKSKTFWQKYWTYIVICSVLISFVGFLAVYNSHLNRQEFGKKLTMFKQPPADAAEGGHWHVDGTWHNEPHEKPPKQVTKPESKTTEKTTEPHPHDLLTDEEHEEVHRKKREKMLQEIEDLKADTARIQSEMEEDKRAAEEQRQFVKLIPDFQKRVVEVLEVSDYNFILTYPTPVQIVEKFSTPESLNAFCKRLTKFQSVIIEVSDEINKRPAFAKRMQREYPDFMDKLAKVRELEIPQFYAGGTK